MRLESEPRFFRRPCALNRLITFISPELLRLGCTSWHQGCNALDQLQWRECDFIDLCAPFVVGFADRLAMLFDTALHQHTARFAQPVQRKRWPCAVAHQTLQAGAVMRCYANAGVCRKTALAVSPHLFSIETFEQSQTDKGAQDSPAQCGLHLGESIRIYARAGVKADARW